MAQCCKTNLRFVNVLITPLSVSEREREGIEWIVVVCSTLHDENVAKCDIDTQWNGSEGWDVRVREGKRYKISSLVFTCLFYWFQFWAVINCSTFLNALIYRCFKLIYLQSFWDKSQLDMFVACQHFGGFIKLILSSCQRFFQKFSILRLKGMQKALNAPTRSGSQILQNILHSLLHINN